MSKCEGRKGKDKRCNNTVEREGKKVANRKTCERRGGKGACDEGEEGGGKG